MRRWLAPVFALALFALVAAGCGGATETATGSVPASAQQAPADALAYVSIDTDLDSDQWKNAQALIDLFPSLEASATKAIDTALSDHQLDWATDVEPALGPELVVVVTADSKPVVLLQPDDSAKLDHLLTLDDSGKKPVKGTVGDWTALAENQADIAAYSAALDRGSLAGVDAFTKAVDALPADALVKAWVDGAGLSENLKKVASQAGQLQGALQGSANGNAADQKPCSVDTVNAQPCFTLGADTSIPFPEINLDSIAMALSAKENGLFVAVDTRGAKLGNGTQYEPKLFAKVPGDAVAALSFGGTQGVVDKLSGPLDKVSGVVEQATGVSLDKVIAAFSGEGVVYVRRGSGSIPEVTAVLAPPDVDETFTTIDTIAHKLAAQSGGKVEQTTLDDVPVSRVDLQGVPLTYGKLDGDTIIVTIGSDAIAAFNGSSERLVETAGFRSAAEEVGLGDRTGGFVYVDLDGLVPLITGLAGEDKLPADARSALESLDSFILETSTDGDSTQVSGFIRVNK